MSAVEMVFWGATGQAIVLRECLSDKTLMALFDNSKDAVSPFPDVPLFHGQAGFERWMESRPAARPLAFVVAIGGHRGTERLRIHDYLKSAGLLPLSACHRTAFVASDAEIGEGSQILAQSAVGARAVLGRVCIVNTSASVDHECVLGDGVHVGPGAHLAGCVTVDDGALIGTGAVVLPRVRIGRGAIVGAGAVVTRRVDDYTVVVGNPAKFLKRAE
jgi:sugar O-acyltransferase (sialic acid O-acetyltransferase NeuD family)